MHQQRQKTESTQFHQPNRTFSRKTSQAVFARPNEFDTSFMNVKDGKPVQRKAFAASHPFQFKKDDSPVQFDWPNLTASRGLRLPQATAPRLLDDMELRIDEGMEGSSTQEGATVNREEQTDATQTPSSEVSSSETPTREFGEFNFRRSPFMDDEVLRSILSLNPHGRELRMPSAEPLSLFNQELQIDPEIEPELSDITSRLTDQESDGVTFDLEGLSIRNQTVLGQLFVNAGRSGIQVGINRGTFTGNIGYSPHTISLNLRLVEALSAMGLNPRIGNFRLTGDLYFLAEYNLSNRAGRISFGLGDEIGPTRPALNDALRAGVEGASGLLSLDPEIFGTEGIISPEQMDNIRGIVTAASTTDVYLSRRFRFGVNVEFNFRPRGESEVLADGGRGRDLYLVDDGGYAFDVMARFQLSWRGDS